MNTMIHALKRWHVGRALVLAVATSVLVASTPRRANADLVEYSILFVFVLLASAAISDMAPQPNSGAAEVLVNNLQTSVQNAANAFSNGDVPGQIAGLSEAIGTATALEGMMSTCDDCGDLTSTLDKIITGATILKTQLLGQGTTCNPSSLVC